MLQHTQRGSVQKINKIRVPLGDPGWGVGGSFSSIVKRVSGFNSPRKKGERNAHTHTPKPWDTKPQGTKGIFTNVSLIDQFRNFHLGDSTQIWLGSFLELTELRSKQSTSPCGCLWPGSCGLHLTSCRGIYCPLTNCLCNRRGDGEGFGSGVRPLHWMAFVTCL